MFVRFYWSQTGNNCWEARLQMLLRVESDSFALSFGFLKLRRECKNDYKEVGEMPGLD